MTDKNIKQISNDYKNKGLDGSTAENEFKNKIFYRLIPAKKIDKNTIQMARIEVLDINGNIITSMTTSKIFKHYNYDSLVERLYIEYKLDNNLC